MSDVIKSLVELYGPAIAPIMFITAVFMSWFYHRLLRQVSIRVNRISLILVDEDIVKLDTLWKYGVLDESVTPTSLIMERMR